MVIPPGDSYRIGYNHIVAPIYIRVKPCFGAEILISDQVVYVGNAAGFLVALPDTAAEIAFIRLLTTCVLRNSIAW